MSLHYLTGAVPRRRGDGSTWLDVWRIGHVGMLISVQHSRPFLDVSNALRAGRDLGALPETLRPDRGGPYLLLFIGTCLLGRAVLVARPPFCARSRLRRVSASVGQRSLTKA